jgi:ABC-type transport system involved in multi-copper enzyme maturation permease subunit
MPSRAGWRIGLGPVFAYEWLTSSRRWQAYALRSAFLLVLLFALVVIWTGPRQAGGSTPLAAMAALGQSFFIAVVGTQLTLVFLIAPAATAGAICLDRARGTLTHMLMTDLSNAEIVLGKLAARLVPVLGLVGCTLPLLAILTLLGGVDPDALLGAFLVTVGVGVLGCSLALAFSVWSGKTHDALLATYAVLGLWLLFSHMARGLNGMFGIGLPVPLATTDPYLLSFAPYWAPGSVTWANYAWFLAVTTSLSVVLVGLAVLRIRVVCTREVVRKKQPAIRWLRGLGRAYRRRLPGPSLDWNPVYWRERHRARPSRWAPWVVVLYFMIALVFSFGVIVGGVGMTAAWVNGLQVACGLLVLSVGAATSLAEERVRGSLDVLLTTRLSTPEIVLGKWLGSYRLVPFLAVLPALVVGAFVWNDLGRVLIVPVVIAYVLCAGAAITSLGLAMATWFSRLGRAVAATVSVYIVIAVGWMFLIMTIRNHGPRSEGLMMASPFFWAGELTFELAANPGRFEAHRDWAIFWTAAAATAALVLLVFTLTNFDRLLGRVESPFLELMRGELKGRLKLFIWSFLSLAAMLTAAGLVADVSMAFFMNGTLISCGLCLAAALAALSTARVRQHGGLERAKAAGLSPRQTVLAVCLGSYRLVGAVTILAALVMLVHEGTNHVAGLTILPMVPYLLGSGAACCGVGFLIGLRFAPRPAVFTATVIVALGLFAVPVASMVVFGGSGPNALWPASPFLCLSAIALELVSEGGPGWDAAWWVLNWAQLYGVAALALWAIAVKRLERLLESDERATIGPAHVRWRRPPAPEPKSAVRAWSE